MPCAVFFYSIVRIARIGHTRQRRVARDSLPRAGDHRIDHYESDMWKISRPTQPRLSDVRDLQESPRQSHTVGHKLLTKRKYPQIADMENGRSVPFQRAVVPFIQNEACRLDLNPPLLVVVPSLGTTRERYPLRQLRCLLKLHHPAQPDSLV